MGRWRAIGAANKADHVVTLLARAGRLPAGTLVEIGCGDGALLDALARRRAASSYAGFELSSTAAALARGRGFDVEAFDGAHVPAADGSFDVAVLSHVLEHVHEPAPLLAEAARVAPLVVVEVPLERNWSARRPAARALAAAAGHLQAFDRAAIHALAAAGGLRVCDELTDALPWAHASFFASGPTARVRACARWALRTALHAAAPRAAARAFTVHHAVLLARAPA